MRTLLPKNQEYYKAIIEENNMLKKKIEEMHTRIGFRKSYSQMSEVHKKRIRKKLKGVIANVNRDLIQAGLAIHRTDIVNYNGDSQQNAYMSFLKEQTRPTADQCLYFKDKYSVSDKCYIQMRGHLCNHLPSLYQLNEKKKEINDLIGSIEHHEKSCFVDIKDKITKILDRFLMKNKNIASFRKIYLKFGLDGTNISRSNKFMNFVVSILNEGKKAATANGNYTLGILKIDKENYEAIQNWLPDKFEKIRTLDYKFDNRNIEICPIFTGDYKMLLLVLGLKNSTSNYPCIWCKIKKDRLHEIKDEIESNKNKKEDLLRGYKEQEEILDQKNSGEYKKIKDFKDFGYENKPLITSIPHKDFIICILHLLLRMSDLFFDLFIRAVEALDKKTNNVSFNSKKHLNLKKLLDFLGSIGINISTSNDDEDLADNKDSKMNKILSNLTGPKRKLVFEKLTPEIYSLFGDKLKDCKKIQKLWSDFYSIYNYLKMPYADGDSLKVLSSELLKLFLDIYHEKHVSPYFHFLVNHAHDILDRNISLRDSSTEGLEKLNDMSTFEYFKVTNKKENFLDQILLRRCRIDYYESYSDKYMIKL